MSKNFVWGNLKNGVSPDITKLEQNVETLNGEVETLNNDIEDLGNIVNTNCAKLNVGNTFSDTSQQNYHLADSVTDYVLRFQCDKFSASKEIDLYRVHRGGRRGGLKVYLSGGNYNYLEYFGKSLISNMMDPTAPEHGANKKYVDNLIKSASLASKTSFSLIDSLNTNNQRFKWFRVDTSLINVNTTNCLQIDYQTSDAKEITFSYKWENETSLILSFCQVNSITDYTPTGTLFFKYK